MRISKIKTITPLLESNSQLFDIVTKNISKKFIAYQVLQAIPALSDHDYRSVEKLLRDPEALAAKSENIQDAVTDEMVSIAKEFSKLKGRADELIIKIENEKAQKEQTSTQSNKTDK